MATSWALLLKSLRQASGQGSPQSHVAACEIVEALQSSQISTSGLTNPELAGDLVLLAQHLQTATSSVQEADTSHLWQTAFCKILRDYVTRKVVVLPPAAASVLIPILRRWAVSPEPPRSTGQRQVEALLTLCLLLQDSSVEVSDSERGTLLPVMVALAEEALPAGATDTSPTSLAKDGGDVFFLEAPWLAVQILGTLLSRFADAFDEAALQRGLSALVNAMDKIGTRPMQSEPASRFYCCTLRAINVVIMEARAAQKAVLPRLATALPKFFTYGVPSAAAAQQKAPGLLPSPRLVVVTPSPQADKLTADGASSSAAVAAAATIQTPSKPAYVPPHLRGKKPAPAATPAPIASVRKPAWRRGSRGSGTRKGTDAETSESDSDMSDADAGMGSAAADLLKSSRVRIAAINTVQTLVKSDPKAMQPYWRNFLPFSSPLQQYPYTPTLVTVLLHDPQPKSRSAAATAVGLLLEGPAQRAYLAVAEVRSSTSKSFMPLSLQLGQLLVCLHAGLFHSIEREAHVGVLVCALRSLTVLLGAAPYERLPGTLIPQAFTHTRMCMGRLSAQSGAASESYHAVALSCLAAALSTKQPVPAMLEELCRDRAQQGALPHAVQELSAAAIAGSAAHIRVEALSALRGAVKNYPSSMQGVWPTVSELMVCNLRLAAEAPSSNPDAKALQVAFRLLETFLQEITDSTPEADGDDEASAASQLGQDMTPEEVASIWERCIDHYLQPGWRMSSSSVRSTAHTVVAKLSRQAFSRLDRTHQQALMEGSTQAVASDTETGVRGAACRALGTLASFPEAMAAEGALQTVTEILVAALRDSSVSVRVPAAWAFANMCGMLAAAHPDVSMLEPHEICQLAGTAVNAARDSDKVRANAVRALGSVVVVFRGQDGHEDWLPQAIQGIVSSLTTGNMKVQWNACVAASNLMKNTVAVALDSVQARLPGLLLLLIMLVRDSPNIKIRTHSAGALMALSERRYYGDAYADAIQVFANFLADNSRSMSPQVESLQAGAANGRSSEGKPLSHLCRQSQATLLHLLALGSAAELPAMRDTLLRRRAFLVSLARAVADFLCPPEASLDAAEAHSSPVLPQDPFGLGRCYTEETPVGGRSAARSSSGAPTADAVTARRDSEGGQVDGPSVAIEEPVLFSKASGFSALLGLSNMYAALPDAVGVSEEVSALAQRCQAS